MIGQSVAIREVFERTVRSPIDLTVLIQGKAVFRQELGPGLSTNFGRRAVRAVHRLERRAHFRNSDRKRALGYEVLI
jgi:hypothetical protein